MLIAMAGLPGTGKSTLAARLKAELAAVVLNKDEVRRVLFPPPVLDYSAAQDDLCMAAIYGAAASILRIYPRQAVILDGRSYARAYQVRDLLAMAASLNEPAHIIECVCDDVIVRQRLERDLERGEHPAGNRTFALYLERKAAAEAISATHLILDTGRTPFVECVRRSLDLVRSGCVQARD